MKTYSEIPCAEIINGVDKIAGTVKIYLDDKLIWDDDTDANYYKAVEPYLMLNISSFKVNVVHYHHSELYMYTK